MPAQTLEYAADKLAESRLSGSLIGVDDIAILSESQAYQVQYMLHQRLVPHLGARLGYKIGCTTKVMQHYLNIDQPCAGGVFATTVVENGADFPASRQGRLGVECEIAVRLATDLAKTNAPYQQEQVAAAVGTVMAAMELVEDRYQDYSSLPVHVLISDDFFNAGCVLGSELSAWQSLDLCQISGRMWVNDELRGEGRGGDILGHPLHALTWLANRLAALDRELKAGEFVLLGSVVQTQWLLAGDHVKIEIDQLGSVQFDVTARA